MEIFRSNFTLHFTINRLNSEYKQFKLTYLQKHSWIVSILSFLLSVICSTLYVVYSLRETENYPEYFWQIYIVSLILTGISASLSFLFLFIKKNYNFLQWSCYSNMFICFFSYSFIRHYILEIGKLEISFYILFFFIDFAGRSSLIFLHILEFLSILILDGVMVASLVIFYSPAIQTSPHNTNSLIYFSFFFILEILLSYYVTREFRIKFHFISKMKKDIKWYRSIFDTTKSGFIKITNRQIAFANSMIKNKMFKQSLLTASNGNEEEHILFQRTESLVPELFCHVKEEIDLVQNRENYIFAFPNSSTDQFYEELKSRYISSGEREFIFLGIKQMATEQDNVLTYEIMYRYYEETECGKVHFEFIFNDVTRTKQNELKNAEFKYKSLFLSKIAHEFKNPLLCITDLAEESNELLERDRENLSEVEGMLSKLSKNISLVNSYSKYLLILVKDFDYFSGALITGAGNNVNKTQTNIEESLNFVADVTNGLLAKTNKKESIEFIMKKDPQLPKEIYTDDTKLKQVLINLTSNSIKFTNAGQIVLSAEAKRGSVEFSVSDTGVGISNELKEKLFKPFLTSGNFKSNLLGAGLGLTIVKDVTNKIGNGVHFTSEVGAGTKFWFSIPILDEQEAKKDFHINLIQPEISYSDWNHSSDTVNISHLILAIENKEIFSLTPLSPKRERISNSLNIIVADDDSFVRNSNVRIVRRVAKDMGIPVNIIEAEDGKDVVDIVIKSNKMRKSINLIISDETMDYICGLESSRILRRLIEDKKILPTPFYLVTAYENVSCKEINGVFTKPLKKENVMEMLTKITKAN